MQRCLKCVNVNTRSRIVFENGICNACNYADMRNKIIPEIWQKREEEFRTLCSKYRRTDGSYDCLVPCSGGKDSMVVAWNMKFKYGMNPLAVTFAPVGETEVGKKNIEALRAAGIDNIVMHVNKKTMSKLCKMTFEKWGDPFLPWVIGIYSFPLRLAKEKGISFVVYAESGEANYGGDPTVSDSEVSLELLNKTIKTGDAADYKQPENWIEFGFSKQELAPFIVPKDLDGIRAVYYAHWHKWGALYNFELAKKIGFRPMDGRMLGSFQGYSSIDDTIDGLYMYIMALKFGFARCTKDCCKEIREGKMTREEAMSLISRYDFEFPYTKPEFRALLKYLDMSSDEFWKTCRKFINSEVWQVRKGRGKSEWVNDERVVLRMPRWKNNDN